MYCISIGEPSYREVINSLENIEFAEIRLDKIKDLSFQKIEEIFSLPKKLIATLRSNNNKDKKKRDYLLKAIGSGAQYIDVEVEYDCKLKNEIINFARSKKCKVIISYHNYTKTPSIINLKKIISKALSQGADIAKISCFVNSNKDNIKLLSLLSENGNIQTIGMGKKGKITRIIAPFLGSPYSFVSLKPGKETAEGQLDVKNFEKIIGILNNVL